MADSTYRYDVFISYSTQDKAWVRGELLQTLEKAGLTVCIDYRDFRVGAPTVTEIRELLKASKKTLVVLTPSYIERDWTEFETLLGYQLKPGQVDCARDWAVVTKTTV